jgi:hypothetical protein
MQFSVIRTRAAVRFGDPNNEIITDNTWKDYVNEAYREVCALERWPFLEATATVTVNANTRSANLPSRAWRVEAVWDQTNKNPLDPIFHPSQVFRDYPNGDETGVPCEYQLRARTIEVYPLPDTNVTLSIRYLAYPGDLSADADVPILPEEYHHVLVILANAKAYRDDGNFQAAQTYESEASVILDAMRRDLLGPRTESYPTILDSWG